MSCYLFGRNGIIPQSLWNICVVFLISLFVVHVLATDGKSRKEKISRKDKLIFCAMVSHIKMPKMVADIIEIIQLDSSTWRPFSGQHIPYRPKQRLSLARWFRRIVAKRHTSIVQFGNPHKIKIRIIKTLEWSLHPGDSACHFQ